MLFFEMVLEVVLFQITTHCGGHREVVSGVVNIVIGQVPNHKKGHESVEKLRRDKKSEE